MANILILGGGFAGLVAAERLSEKLGSGHQITLVSPKRIFTFYPALVQFAFGNCETGDITFDLAEKLHDLNVHFVEGEAININPDRRAVKIAGDDFDGEIHYDYLIAAVGRRLATEKTPGFFEHAHHLLGTKAALKFGAAVEEFTEGEIIVGLCPEARLPVPVCETAFALARKFEREIEEGKIRIKVIFPESLEAAFGGANFHKELETAFKRHRINVLYDVPICEITNEEVLSSKKHRIRYDLLMLVPSFRGNAVFRGLGASDDEDFIKVNGLMQIQDTENAFAAGDIVAFSGPKFAHMAVRQARVAADNVLAEINGGLPEAEYYHEIKTIIDAGGAESIYLHYGVWDEHLFRLKKGKIWGLVKRIHDRLWQAAHQA